MLDHNQTDAFHIRSDDMPTEMQTLLQTYPRDTWDAHPGFHDKTRHWLGAHRMFRQLSASVRKDTESYLNGDRDAHDYAGHHVTSIAQEKARNPRLGNDIPKEEFIAIMNGLDLPYPRKIDFAVPGNEACGVCPPNVPDYLRSPCEVHDQG